MPQPKPQPTPRLKKLDTPEDLATARFGRTDGLAIVQQTTLELAEHYAKRFDLDVADSEVCLITSALAFTRHKEFLLFVECERDLQRRVLEHPTAEYGEVLFSLTRTGAHNDIHKEIDRLHLRANKYIKELKVLQRENTDHNKRS